MRDKESDVWESARRRGREGESEERKREGELESLKR